HEIGGAYAIQLNGAAIFRPYQNVYEWKPKNQTKFHDVEYFQVEGISGGIDAVGWILHSDYLGAIPEQHGIEGLRLRVGNMQIGDSRILDSVFPESRFNAWAVGECHVLSPKLVPNAR